jgi:TIR domain
MSDIFISYNQKDKSKAELFARVFEQENWAVFWDKAIPPGKTFDQYINDQLEAAKCVVVLWSEGSVNSDWVKEEAQRGAQRKILVPVFISKVSPPLGFGRIEAAELFDWEGDTSEVEFQNLLKAIRALILAHKEAIKEQTPQLDATNISPGVISISKNKPLTHESQPVFIVSPKTKKYMFTGLVSLAVLVILFLIWRFKGEILIPSSSLDGEAKLVTGGFGVVLGSDVSIEAARDEITRASKNGIKSASLYLRNGYYASIAIFENQTTAQDSLKIAKNFRSDAYVARMGAWCRNPQQRKGYVECQSVQLNRIYRNSRAN